MTDPQMIAVRIGVIHDIIKNAGSMIERNELAKKLDEARTEDGEPLFGNRVQATIGRLIGSGKLDKEDIDGKEFISIPTQPTRNEQTPVPAKPKETQEPTPTPQAVNGGYGDIIHTRRRVFTNAKLLLNNNAGRDSRPPEHGWYPFPNFGKTIHLIEGEVDLSDMPELKQKVSQARWMKVDFKSGRSPEYYPVSLEDDVWIVLGMN